MVAVVGTAIEVVLQRYPVIAAISLNYKVIAFTCKGCFLCLRTLKAQRVRLFVVITVVFDGIFAMTGTELVGIAFNSTTFQMVITSATIKRVMSGSAVEMVVAFVAVQNVIAALSIQRVIAFSAVQHVIAITASQAVIAAISMEGVIAAIAIEGVVTSSATQVVSTVITAQGVIVVCADAVSQGGECFFAKGIAVSLKGTVIARFLRVLHEFLGKRCHVGVFAVGVAFSEQFAEIGEGFARFFCVHFVKEGCDTAVVQLQFAVLVHAEADGVEVGFEAGLEEQAVV